MVDQFIGPESSLGKSLGAPGNAFSADKGFAAFNDPAIWSAAIPAANGITDARSLARLYAACVGEVDGFRLLDDDTVTRAIERQTEGVDKIIMELDLHWGLGFMVPSTFLKLGGPRSFGHYGAGGSVGFGDLDAELSFGYVMNQMFLGLSGDQRTMTLIDAAYDSL
jgi:CubicO group peptidase (beta-lactamase class C family)